MISKENFMQRITKASAESPEFRAKFMADPKSTIEANLKFKLPDNLEIVVHEDTPNKLNIVLPAVSEELSEIELSAVSGGVCWDDCDDNSCGCT